MPSMQAANWPMISGFSGLPKFRQSVIASGVAPTAVRLRQASATACRPPSTGIGEAVARRAVRGNGDALRRAEDAQHGGVAPGRCTVEAITMWSYCSQIQRLLARSGQASSRCSAAMGSFSGGSERASSTGAAASAVAAGRTPAPPRPAARSARRRPPRRGGGRPCAGCR